MIKGSSDYARALALRIENAELRDDPETNTVRSLDGYQVFFLAKIDAGQKERLVRYHVHQDQYFVLNKKSTSFERIATAQAPDLTVPFTTANLLRDKKWSEGVAKSVVDRITNATADQLAGAAAAVAIAVATPYAIPYISLAASQTFAAWHATSAAASAAGAAAARVGARIGIVRITETVTAAGVGSYMLYDAARGNLRRGAGAF